MTKALRMGCIVLVLAALLPSVGCVKRTPAPDQSGTVLEDESQAYAYAVQAYLSGDYEASARLFGELADTALDDLMGRRAFYGLALSRLAGAETPEEFDAAMALWSDWASLAPARLPAEDPRLLAPLIDRVGSRLKKAEQVLAPEQPVPDPQPQVLCPDLSEQEKLLNAARQETGALKARLKELALENERLRNQLSALEALHQEILIKKKGFD